MPVPGKRHEGIGYDEEYDCFYAAHKSIFMTAQGNEIVYYTKTRLRAFML